MELGARGEEGDQSEKAVGDLSAVPLSAHRPSVRVLYACSPGLFGFRGGGIKKGSAPPERHRPSWIEKKEPTRR